MRVCVCIIIRGYILSFFHSSLMCRNPLHVPWPLQILFNLFLWDCIQVPTCYLPLLTYTVLEACLKIELSSHNSPCVKAQYDGQNETVSVSELIWDTSQISDRSHFGFSRLQCASEPHQSTRREGQLLGDGPHRAVWAVHRNTLHPPRRQPHRNMEHCFHTMHQVMCYIIRPGIHYVTIFFLVAKFGKKDAFGILCINKKYIKIDKQFPFKSISY